MYMFIYSQRHAQEANDWDEEVLQLRNKWAIHRASWPCIGQIAHSMTSIAVPSCTWQYVHVPACSRSRSLAHSTLRIARQRDCHSACINVPSDLSSNVFIATAICGDKSNRPRVCHTHRLCTHPNTVCPYILAKSSDVLQALEQFILVARVHTQKTSYYLLHMFTLTVTLTLTLERIVR